MCFCATRGTSCVGWAVLAVSCHLRGSAWVLPQQKVPSEFPWGKKKKNHISLLRLKHLRIYHILWGNEAMKELSPSLPQSRASMWRPARPPPPQSRFLKAPDTACQWAGTFPQPCCTTPSTAPCCPPGVQGCQCPCERSHTESSRTEAEWGGLLQRFYSLRAGITRFFHIML